MGNPMHDPHAMGLSPFGRLAVAHAVSMIGDTCVTVALAGTLFFNISPGAARPKVLLYLLLTVAPFVLVAPVIGPLLDRSRGGRRTLMSAGCFGRAALCVVMAGNVNTLLLFPLAFGVLVLAKGHQVAKSALVPAMVSDEAALVTANSRLALISIAAAAIGGIPAAIVLKVTGADWVLVCAAIAFTVAGFLVLRIPKGDRDATPETAEERAELHAPSIVLAGTAMALLRAGVGFLTFLVAFGLKAGKQPTWFFGAVLAVSAVGGFIGNVLAPFLRRRVKEEWILVGSLLAPAVVALWAARAGGRWGYLFTAVFVATGAAAGKVAFDSLLQRDGPDDLRGRAFARFETRFQLVWVLGALVPVALFDVMDARVGFFVLAVMLGFGGVSYVIGLRAARDRPPGAATKPPLVARLRSMRRPRPPAPPAARPGSPPPKGPDPKGSDGVRPGPGRQES
jgi:predicted MFS family arabinose efflux permease